MGVDVRGEALVHLISAQSIPYSKWKGRWGPSKYVMASKRVSIHGIYYALYAVH